MGFSIKIESESVYIYIIAFSDLFGLLYTFCPMFFCIAFCVRSVCADLSVDRGF